MPLSKKRDRDRKRLQRETRLESEQFQPKTVTIEGKEYKMPELDADGEVIPDVT